MLLNKFKYFIVRAVKRKWLLLSQKTNESLYWVLLEAGSELETSLAARVYFRIKEQFEDGTDIVRKHQSILLGLN